MMYVLRLFLACLGNLSFISGQVPEKPAEEISIFPLSDETVTRIYFIHNAESEYSMERGLSVKYTSGRSPEVALSEKGREQARRLGDLLSSRLEEGVVFMPPAKRTWETAEPFLSEKIVFDSYSENLFEVSMGQWEGKPKDSAYQAAYLPWKNLSAAEKYGTPKVSDGESYDEAAKRALFELERILQAHPDKTILIVSGENLLNALAIYWMHLTLSQEPGSNLPCLPIKKGDFLLVEVSAKKSIEQAEMKTIFHIDCST